MYYVHYNNVRKININIYLASKATEKSSLLSDSKLIGDDG